jgi:peptidoglycan/LPS O-acetylase OafA/YrhL
LFQNTEAWYGYTLAFTAVAFGYGALVAAALSPGFGLSRWRIPGAAGVAALAFTLYLTHKQMIHLAATLVDEPKEHKAATLAVAAALCLAASAVLHFAFEKPCLRLRDRLLARS